VSDVAAPRETALEAEPAAPTRRRRYALETLWATRARAAFFVAAVGIITYVLSVWDGFAYDDVAIIPGDPRITKLKLLEIFQLPYWHNLAIYRPLTTLSFAVDWLLSRGYPWYFHAINVLEHGAVCALVFLLLAELFSPAAALAGALLFAVHPVHVEAVTNVVGRAEVVSALFYLGAILIWVRGGSRPRPWRVAVITVCFAVALLHKESSATLPAAIVLVDAALGRWSFRPAALKDYLRRLLPLVAAMAVVFAGFVWLRLTVLGGRMSPDVYDSIFDLPMGRVGRLMTALQAWPMYGRVLFFPRTLLADYGPRILMPAFGWNGLALLGLGIILFLLIGGIDALASGRGRAALAFLWFPVTVLPVSNLLFPIGIIVAERTLYLPMLALCVGVAIAVDHQATLPAASRRLRRGLLVAFATVLAAFAARTIVRIPQWDSTDKIFYALRDDAPESFRAWWHLARIARRENKPELEMRRYETAMRLWPYRKALVLEVIARSIANKRTGEARNIAAFAVTRFPNEVSAQRYLAATSLDLGDTATARSAARAGLALAPTDSLLVAMAARILGRGGAAPAPATGARPSAGARSGAPR